MLGAFCYGVLIVAIATLLHWIIDRKNLRLMSRSFITAAIVSFITSLVVALWGDHSFSWFVACFAGMLAARYIALRAILDSRPLPNDRN